MGELYLFVNGKEQMHILENLENKGFLWESGRRPTDFPIVQNLLLCIDKNSKKINYISPEMYITN